jgi:hypothetical protein
MTADATGLRAAATDPARQSVEKIATANAGKLAPSREEAAAILAARGIHPDAHGSAYPAHKPPSHKPDAYAGTNLDHVKNLPEDTDPAGAAEGGRTFGYALDLPPYLADALTKDMATAPEQSAEAVAAQLDKIGISYPDAIKAVDDLIGRGTLRLGREIPLKAKDLSAFALSQLAVFAAHVAKHSGQKR